MHDKKLQDILPQPPPALPPVDVEVLMSTLPNPPQTLLPLPSPEGHPSPNCAQIRSQSGLTRALRKILETKRNAFGLFRRYFSIRFPSHDPDSEGDISTLSNIVDSGEPLALSYDPYPNENSFRLGEWYWNHGVQKSQTSFKELVSIVGAVDFQPSNVRSTNWDKINGKLAKGSTIEEGEWVDEDTGWATSPVKISVPFHRYMSSPGPQDYTVANFHHRSLVSVIREKLSNEKDNPHFHYEPYELLWQISEEQDPTRVYGEYDECSPVGN